MLPTQFFEHLVQFRWAVGHQGRNAKFFTLTCLQWELVRPLPNTGDRHCPLSLEDHAHKGLNHSYPPSEVRLGQTMTGQQLPEEGTERVHLISIWLHRTIGNFP